MKTPKVSVIIPVYNEEKYLRQCLDSVVNQTLGDIEIICVDDGSTDASLEILREYEEDDSRVHVITQKNKNAGAARNNGMEHAHGKYLLFLDADDYFEANMLKETVSLAQRNDADVTLFGAWRFDNTTGKVENMTWYVQNGLMPAIQPFSAQENPRNIFQITPPGPCNKLFKSSFVKENGLRFQELTNTNDMFFVLSALSDAERICWTDKQYLHYRIGNGASLQATKGKNPDNFYRSLTALRDRLVITGKYELFRESFLKNAEIQCNFNFKAFTDEQLCPDERRRFRETLLDDGKLIQHEDKPDVSVIVPVYNTEDYLRECLDSILCQTLNNIEIICVNDGSTDSSGEILAQYAAKDARIRIIDKGKNEGLFMARKRGVAEAKGRFITFVDADDGITPQACEIIVREMDKSGMDVTQYGIDVRNYTRDPFATVWHEKALQPTGETLDARGMLDSFFIKHSNSTQLWGKAYRSALIKMIYSQLDDQYCTVGEDIFSFFFICLYCVSYKGVPGEKIYTYNYGRGIGNVDEMSIGKFSNYCDMSRCVRYAKDFLSAHEENAVLNTALNAMGRRMMTDCCRILRNRISEENKQTAAKMLTESWSEFSFFESVLVSTLDVDRQGFEAKYISIPIFNRTAPAFVDGGMPKVSVVIPIYNVEQYLEECLESIVNQTLKEIEIVCVNDGSTDNSLDLVERYAEKDNRIAVISKYNDGLSSARNRGMSEAHGKYLYFMDSDDILAQDALRQLYESAEADKLDMILFCADSFFETKQLELDNSTYISYYRRNNVDGVVSGEELISSYLTNNNFKASVPLQFYNREFLTGTRIQFMEKVIYEDELFSALILSEARRLRVCSERFYKRRVRSSSTMTSNKPCKRFESLYVISLNLLIAASGHANSGKIHDFFVRRGKSFYNTAKEEYKKLSDAERKTILANMPEEYRFFLTSFPIEATAVSMGHKESVKQFDEAAEIRKSWSYRIGRFMTWIPRKIRGGIRCYKEHGFKYTYYRFLKHLHLK